MRVLKTRFDVWVVVLTFTYCVVQALSFSLFKTGGDIDTAELLLHIQSWELGYGGSQPPLYNWIAKAITELFGLSLIALSFAKFFFFGLILIFLYLSARKLELGTWPSLAAMLGLFLMPELGWETQRSLAHSLPMLAFCVIGFRAFLVATETGRLLPFLTFGACFGLSVLSKYNGAVFFVALILTALTMDRFRQTVLSAKMLLATALGAVLLLPHLLWAADNQARLVDRADKFGIGTLEGVEARIAGALSFSSAFAQVVGLLVLVAVIALFVARRRGSLTGDNDTSGNLPARIVIIALALILVGVLVTGSVNVLNRWLSPALLLFPLALSIRFSDLQSQPLARPICYVGACLAALYAIALPLSIHAAGDDAARRSNLDYGALWTGIESEAGDICAILTDDHALLSNLRLVDEELAIAHMRFRPDLEPGLECPAILAWRGQREMPPDLGQLAKANGYSVSSAPPASTRAQRIDDPDETVVISYQLLEMAEPAN